MTRTPVTRPPDPRRPRGLCSQCAAPAAAELLDPASGRFVRLCAAGAAAALTASRTARPAA